MGQSIRERVKGRKYIFCLTNDVQFGFLLQIYGETRVLPRGLTHPVAAGQAGVPKPRKREPQSVASRLVSATGASFGGRKNEFLSPDNNEDSGVQNTELGNGVSGSFLKRWGAVAVSGKALVSLLRAGETVLLFPGGGTEVSVSLS